MFKEFNDSPKERIGDNGTEVVRRFHGPWDERFLFVDTLLESPSYPPIPTAVLTGISMDPYGACAEKDESDRIFTVNTYEEVLVEVTYGFGQNTGDATGVSGESGATFRLERANRGGKDEEFPNDGTYLELQVQGQLEHRTLKSGRGLKWEHHTARKVPVDFGHVLTVPTSTYVYSKKRMSEADFPLYDSLLGATNEKKYILPIAKVPCPPETLLFEGYKTSVSFSYKKGLQAAVYWEIDFHFAVRNLLGVPRITGPTTYDISDGKEKVVGWNHFFSEGVTPGWQRLLYNPVGAAGQGPPLIRLGSLSRLLR